MSYLPLSPSDYRLIKQQTKDWTPRKKISFLILGIVIVISLIALAIIGSNMQ